jgi:hypothetical protein
MFNRRIDDDDVKDVIKSGRIIEEYPEILHTRATFSMP